MTSLRIVFIFFVLVIATLHHCAIGEERPHVPCYFVFGDSLSDNGNNNDLMTLAKSNYLPYGIDFPLGPTGRFTNGRTVVDVLAELMGFADYIPPHGQAKPADLIRGINYASGSAGIRDESGTLAGFHLSMNMQLLLHKNTVDRLISQFGQEKAHKHLNKCLYSVGMGNNDYLNNYLIDLYPTNRMYTPQQFAKVLAEQYSKQLQTLYGYGARKIVLIGVASLGCIPSSITRYGNISKTKPCVEAINDMSLLFNDKLIELVKEFNKKLPESSFTYVNISGMSRPEKLIEYGFTNSHQACCNVSVSGMCLADQKPCKNRDKYFYYDEFHPCDAANELIAKRMYKDLRNTSVYPYDIDHLLTHNP